MKLSFVLGEGGFTATSIDTKATVTIENGAIPFVHLDVEAVVPGASAEDFQKMAQTAKENCPISKLLNTEITMTAILN